MSDDNDSHPKQQRLPLTWQDAPEEDNSPPKTAAPKPKASGKDDKRLVLKKKIADTAAAEALPEPEPESEPVPEPVVAELQVECVSTTTAPEVMAKAGTPPTTNRKPVALKADTLRRVGAAAKAKSGGSKPPVAPRVPEEPSTPATPVPDVVLPMDDDEAADPLAGNEEPKVLKAIPATRARTKPKIALKRSTPEEPEESTADTTSATETPVPNEDAAPEQPPEEAVEAAVAAQDEGDDQETVETLTIPASGSVTLGQTLAQARETQGLTIGQVGKQTRIRPDFIRHLEADQYEQLPSTPLYTKSYIKRLCELYRLQEDEILTAFEERMAEVRRHRAATTQAELPPTTDSIALDEQPANKGVGLMLAWGITAIVIVIAALTLLYGVRHHIAAGDDVPAGFTSKSLNEGDLQELLPVETLRLEELTVPETD